MEIPFDPEYLFSDVQVSHCVCMHVCLCTRMCACVCVVLYSVCKAYTAKDIVLSPMSSYFLSNFSGVNWGSSLPSCKISR